MLLYNSTNHGTVALFLFELVCKFKQYNNYMCFATRDKVGHLNVIMFVLRYNKFNNSFQTLYIHNIEVKKQQLKHLFVNFIYIYEKIQNVTLHYRLLKYQTLSDFKTLLFLH